MNAPYLVALAPISRVVATVAFVTVAFSTALPAQAMGVEIVRCPETVTLPAPEGGNCVLTVAIYERDVRNDPKPLEVWVARSPRAAGVFRLAPVGGGRFQGNLAERGALEALSPTSTDKMPADQMRKDQGLRFWVFARRGEGETARSVPVRYRWTATLDESPGVGALRVRRLESGVEVSDRFKPGIKEVWVTPAEVRELRLESFGAGGGDDDVLPTITESEKPEVFRAEGTDLVWRPTDNARKAWQEKGRLAVEWRGRKWDLRARPTAIRIRNGVSEFSVSQRRAARLPGVRRYLTCAIGDITGGRVEVRIVDAEGRTVLEARRMRQQDTARFRFGGEDYVLELRTLQNVLIGTDRAMFGLLSAKDVVAPEAKVDETARIRKLIADVAASKLQFLRNGRSYPGEIAARLLQGKWDQRPGLRSVDEFIRVVGTKSGTTDMPYEVALPDGTKQSMAEWLKARADESQSASQKKR